MLHRPGNPDALTQQMIDIVSQDGKIYGIPYIAYVMGMWYNVDLFTEAGLVDENGIPLYPTTYDERIETAVTRRRPESPALSCRPATASAAVFF